MTVKIDLPDAELSQIYPSLDVVAPLLLNSGLRIAVAESCTGGLFGGALTEVSGSSVYMVGGVIAYDDMVKKLLLSVPDDLIRESGAVSEECAREMARGVAKLLSADIGVSITGISGPLGGSDAKPVGTTYIGLYTSDFERVEHYRWNGNRTENRNLSVDAALSMVGEYLAMRKNIGRDIVAELKRDE